MPVIQRYFARLMSLDPIRRQSLISFANIIGLTILGYIATMYFAHVLGPAVLGSYYLFLSYYSIFNLLGDGGFGGATAKRISEGRDENEYFSAFIVLRILLLAVSVTILIAISPFLVDFTSSGLLPWLILTLIIGTIAGFASTGLYGLGKVGVSQTSDFLNNAVRILTQIVATYLGYAVAGLAGGVVVGILTGILINFHYLPLRLAKFEIDHLKSLFSFSFWMFLTSSGLVIFSTIDTILIGYFLSNTDVGIYRIAFQLSTVALFISAALSTVLFPRISRWSTDGNFPSISAALSRAFTYSLLFAIPVVAGGIVLGEQLLIYLYGVDFIAGTPALILLLLMEIVSVFVALQIMCLNALDRPKKSFISTSLAVSGNILLNLALIPALGITGSALATLISVSMNAFLSYRYLSQSITISLERTSLRNILIAAAVMSGAVLIFRLSLGIGSFLSLLSAIGIGAGIYFLVLFRLDHHIRYEIRDLIRTLGGV